MADVERELASLDDLEGEAAWVAGALRDFDALWDVMNPTNRYRLVHALVREVRIDDESGTMTAILIDFDETTDAAGEPPDRRPRASTTTVPETRA